MPTDIIPVLIDSNTEEVGTVEGDGPLAVNNLFTTYNRSVPYATQRPSLVVKQQSSSLNSSIHPTGRGVYFWYAAAVGSNNGKYYVIDNVVYRNSIDDGSAIGLISAGKDPVYITDIKNSSGSYMVIIDPENNQGWYIDSAAADSLVEITDADFPNTLVGGVVGLGGIVYVMDEDGIIYNSTTGSAPSAWDANDFITPERAQDGGVFIAAHKDNIVAILTKSIEFFYDAGNPNGSPLNRRPDLFFNFGGIDPLSVTTSGSRIYFIGSETKGLAGVYSITDFQLEKISNENMDTLITPTLTTTGSNLLMEALQFQEHSLLFLSFVRKTEFTDFTFTGSFPNASPTVTLTDDTDFNGLYDGLEVSNAKYPGGTAIAAGGINFVAGTITLDQNSTAASTGDESFTAKSSTGSSPREYYVVDSTYVYDVTSKTWGVWKTTISDNTSFPIVSITSKTALPQNEPDIMLLSGDICTLANQELSADYIIGEAYFQDDDYIENQDNYIENTSFTETSSVPWRLNLPLYDGGISTTKFCNWARLKGYFTAQTAYGTETDASGNVSDSNVRITWSDDNYKSYSSARFIQGKLDRKMTRLGKFNRRSFQLRYTGVARTRVEGLEVYLRAATYG